MNRIELIVPKELAKIKPAHAKLVLNVERRVRSITNAYEANLISEDEAIRGLLTLKPALNLIDAYWDEYWFFEDYEPPNPAEWHKIMISRKTGLDRFNTQPTLSIDLRSVMKKPCKGECCPYCGESKHIAIPYGRESELYARCYECNGDWVPQGDIDGRKD